MSPCGERPTIPPCPACGHANHGLGRCGRVDARSHSYDGLPGCSCVVTPDVFDVGKRLVRTASVDGARCPDCGKRLVRTASVDGARCQVGEKYEEDKGERGCDCPSSAGTAVVERRLAVTASAVVIAPDGTRTPVSGVRVTSVDPKFAEFARRVLDEAEELLLLDRARRIDEMDQGG